MAESPLAAELEQVLDRCCDLLQRAVDVDPTALVDRALQRKVENAVRSAVGELAAETAEPPAVIEQQARPIQARDLLLVADLVRRALAAKTR